MALQFSTTILNAQLDAIESNIGTSAKLDIYTGSAPANCAAADTGTKLISISLPSDWMNAASGGTKTLLGTWSGTATAGSAATPGYHRFKDSTDTTTGMQGSCGIGSGDLSFNGTITSGQTVTVTAYTLTAGGA